MLDSNSQPLALSSQPVDAKVARTALTVYTQSAESHAGAGEPLSAPSLLGLLAAMRRRWLLAGTLALLGAFTAVLAVLYLLPAQYSAYTRIQLASRADPNVFVPAMNAGESDFFIYKASMASLIRSPLVINAALNQVKDLAMIRQQPMPVLWLEKQMKTDFLLSPETLRLSLGGDQPEEVAKVVNAVTEAFMKELRNQEKAKWQTRIEALEDNLRGVQADLDRKRNALRTRIKQGNLEDPELLKARYMAALADLNTARKAALDNQVEQIKSQQQLQAKESKLKNNDKSPIPDFQLDQAMKQHPVALELFKQIGETTKTIQQISDTAAKDRKEALLAPQYAKLAGQEKQVTELRERLRPDLEKSIRKDIAGQLEQEIYQLKDALVSLKKQKELLADEVKLRDEEAAKLKNIALPLDVLAMQDDITSLLDTQSKLKATIASLKAEAVSPRVTWLERAEVPMLRDYGRQVKFAGVAGAGMFFFALFGVSWWEFRARRISAANDVTRGLKMSLVGTLPELPASARRPATSGTSPRDLRWQSQLAEAVDGIRTLLLHAARTESLQVVMVTSAMNGEGKTSLASQLAASLARAWRKTLLVDGDLRHPAAHSLFGLSQEPGFSEVLRGEVAPADVVRPTPLSRLWLMPAGHWDSHAVQALAQESVRDMFSQLKTQYDFVVVDSCPVLPVADALLLGQHVDAVIFSILRDVSRVPTVHAAQQKLNNLGIRTLGAVVIGDRDTHNSMASKYQAKAAV